MVAKSYIERALTSLPIEADIVTRVFNALKDAGRPILAVFDGDDNTPVDGTLYSVQELVFNLDECYLNVDNGGWVRIVLGNEWDCLVDYTLSLEDILKPVNDYIEQNW